MINLLNAGVMRLKKDNIFKILLGLIILLALFMLSIQYKEAKQFGTIIKIEQLFFYLATMVGVGISVLVSLFIGTDYSDGTIRNKVIAGKKRSKIYLSNFIIMVTTSLILYALFTLIIFSIGIPLFGNITMPLSAFIERTTGIIGIIFTYNALFTFIAMIIQNKTTASVISILLAFALIFISLIIFNILASPPTIQTANIINGTTEFKEERNPKYPTETERKIYETIFDIIPSGQAFQITNEDEKNLKILPVYALITTTIFTGIGLIIFKKKDLK